MQAIQNAKGAQSAQNYRQDKRQTRIQTSAHQSTPVEDSFQRLQVSEESDAQTSTRQPKLPLGLQGFNFLPLLPLSASKANASHADGEPKETPESLSGYVSDDEKSETSRPGSPEDQPMFLLDEELAQQKQPIKSQTKTRNRHYSFDELGQKMLRLTQKNKSEWELPSPRLEPRPKTMPAERALDIEAGTDSELLVAAPPNTPATPEKKWLSFAP